MSVILTGMEMPENCRECEFCTTDACNGIDWNAKSIDFTIIQKDCPLKSVDGLIEKIDKIGGNENKSIYKNLNPSYVQGLKDAIKIIKEYCGMEEKDGSNKNNS